MCEEEDQVIIPYEEWKQKNIHRERMKEALRTLEKLKSYDLKDGYNRFCSSLGRDMDFQKMTPKKLQYFNKKKQNYENHKDKTFSEVLIDYQYTDADFEGLKECVLKACYHAVHYKHEDDPYHIDRQNDFKFIRNFKAHKKEIEDSPRSAALAKNYIKKHRLYFERMLNVKNHFEKRNDKYRGIESRNVDELINSLNDGMDEYWKVFDLFLLPLPEGQLYPINRIVSGNMRWHTKALGEGSHNNIVQTDTMLMFELAIYFKSWTYPRFAGCDVYASLFRPFDYTQYEAIRDPYEIDQFSMPLIGDPCADIIAKFIHALHLERSSVRKDLRKEKYTSRQVREKLSKISNDVSLTSWERHGFF